MPADEPHLYARIAAELREDIRSGRLPAGANLPTLAQLRATYGASTTVARQALTILKLEGLIEGRRGSGVYVTRRLPRIVRETSDHYRQDAIAHAGVDGGVWEHHSERTVADEDVAERLAIAVGDPVMMTTYRLMADGQPVQLTVSWEPLALTGATPVQWPENGPAVGVVARMALIGRRCAKGEERISSPSAAVRLRAAQELPASEDLLFIRRTHRLDDGTPVETADLVGPFEVVNRFTID